MELPPDLMTSVDVAKVASVKLGTVRQYVARGQLHPLTRVGNAYVFLKSEVERFMANRRGPGNPNFLR